MRVVAVTRDPERQANLPPDWELHVTDDEIGKTYFGLTQRALQEKWGLETIVVQDDTRFLVEPQPIDTHQLVIYGQSRDDPVPHVCPKAFAATGKVWQILSISWGSQPDSLCAWWMPVVEAFGVVLDQTEQAVYG
jgi:hypothetical protein